MSDAFEVEVRKSEFELCPPGNHFGSVICLVDAGWHDENDSKTGAVFSIRKLIVGYELSVNKKDGSPFYFAETMSLSLTQGSKLYKLCEKLQGGLAVGSTVSVRGLLGRPCLVEITHTEGKSKSGESRTYPKLNGVSSVPQGMPPIPPRRAPLIWSVAEGTPIPDIGFLPQIYGDKPVDIVRSSKEFKEGKVPAGTQAQAGTPPPLGYLASTPPPQAAPPQQQWTPPPQASGYASPPPQAYPNYYPPQQPQGAPPQGYYPPQPQASGYAAPPQAAPPPTPAMVPGDRVPF
jgi:hypothetical protein